MQGLIRRTMFSISQISRSAQKAPREEISFVVSPREDRSIKIPIKTFVDNNLGQVLRSNKIPLEFKCGFSCECATCAIQIQQEDKFEQICEEQPKEHEESITLASEGKDKTYRLSCQLVTTKDMDGITILF
ncbi:2 iron, 2 sulfur cluster-binding protein (macronuclear) [Tetrahymena thermophila SB210]|uniref:2 iron, 2 sulfur cluster-binding protein n=1 Tax=Tetrahymena thermophila (strain SB210) TaxID=312017 RepID=Q23QI1_TETTS|nr:2 iron, 2 sulfur cluster-binding protein [Tetrahymena thermophila SB210]EAR98907.1 2 iron, 2 sulfur cluster-binding protein [Tetrahymena thermophila SB210]|eukprot:XP_001019152.1 2 iron, 2 sulfur cluster-binding protein [Tetrahymena thermophila SB210]